MRCSSPVTRTDPIADMNITPLIDVLLVLLVMLIITIPIATHSVKLDLPGPAAPVTAQPVRNIVQITRDGSVLWNGQRVTEAALVQNLDMTRRVSPSPELHLRPDADARYEDVDAVLAVIKREHVTRFGFVGNERYAEVF